MNLFCFGFGYVATHVATLVRARGGTVFGTQRIVHDQTSIFAWHGQRDLSRAGMDALSHATGILISIPPHAEGCPVIPHIDALRRSFSDLQWVGYLSTTSVYGDTQGAWVDETAALQPTSPRAQHRILAERQWQDWGERHSVPVQIFRLSGIYGPADGFSARSPFERISQGDGRIIDAPGHVFNRVHVADIAQTLLAGYAYGQSGVYNVSDDLPAPQSDVMQFAYDLLGLKAPDPIALQNAALSPMAQEFYRECKRVCNEKIKNELGVRLHYPTYIDGLSAIYKDSETAPLRYVTK